MMTFGIEKIDEGDAYLFGKTCCLYHFFMIKNQSFLLVMTEFAGL